MTATRIHLALAALMGFAGVALLAAAAHVAVDPAHVLTAGQMLLFHASVIIGATAARRGGHLHDLLARVALSAIILGAALFAADLARRGFGGTALFPRAAPIGGWFMLGGWLGLAVAAVTVKRG